MRLKLFAVSILFLIAVTTPKSGQAQALEPEAAPAAVEAVLTAPVVAAPAVVTEPVFCVFKDLLEGETCPAYSSARVIEIQSVGGETVLFVEKDPTALKAKPERTSIVASSRIEDAVLLEEYDVEDAVLLENEMRGLSGARYELPESRREIKRLVGFPDNAEIAKEDWVEMLRVHAEMALSLSANASQFVLDQLGLVSDRPAAVAAHSLDPVVIETH